nr:SMI1/KNR4 family protein [uncultured Kingella sp.]
MLEFYNCEKRITEQEIKKIETDLGVVFPVDFKKHYLTWNGGRPSKSLFLNEDIDCDYIEIRDFIPMKFHQVFENDPDFTLEGRTKNEWENMRIPGHLIPYAFDWGGNYICINKNDGKIFFYVRDVWSNNISREANFSKNSILIAKSFTDFLSHLEISE